MINGPTETETKVIHELSEFLRFFGSWLRCSAPLPRMAWRSWKSLEGNTLRTWRHWSMLFYCQDYSDRGRFKTGQAPRVQTVTLFNPLQVIRVFTVLVAVFHVLESTVKGLLHREGMAGLC